MAQQVRILTQEDGGDEVIMALQITTNSAAREGANVYWHIETIQPALALGMGGGVVPGLLLFSVMVHGAKGQRIVRGLTDGVGTKTGSEPGICCIYGSVERDRI